MANLLVSPHLVDLVLALTFFEAAVLWVWHRRRATGPGPRALVGLLLPGLCLMLGLRAALAGAAWPWVPLALTAALVAHLADLAVRYRR
jgi:hypothetical protein